MGNNRREVYVAYYLGRVIPFQSGGHLPRIAR